MDETKSSGPLSSVHSTRPPAMRSAKTPNDAAMTYAPGLQVGGRECRRKEEEGRTKGGGSLMYLEGSALSSNLARNQYWRRARTFQRGARERQTVLHASLTWH